MIRTAAPRAIVGPLCKSCLPASRSLHRLSSVNSSFLSRPTSLVAQHAKPLAITAYRSQTALTRSYASAVIPGTVIDHEREARIAKEIIKPEPQIVSTTSTVHPITTEVGQEQPKEEDQDMMAGVRHDMKVIQETFALQDVPTEAYRVGLAGVLPYLATSTATVACAMEMNVAAHSGSGGYVLSAESAEALLHFLEPLQVGYGAVIISFLGAIHWGLEWAGYGGYGGYRRYAIGIIAPAIAWPTIFLPVEYALVTQFLAFNILYAVDSHTTVRGWTPPWYATYRFVLTAVVGASIVITLIGRGQIQDMIGELPTATQRMRDFTKTIQAAEAEGEEAVAEEEAAEGEEEE